MVRTLDGALTTALNAVTRRPALTLTMEDHVLHYAPYQNPGTGDALHDACIASDNSIIRCYLSRNGFTSTCYVQRITDPTVALQWSTWTALSGSANIMFQDGGIAIAKWPDNSLHIYAQRGTSGNGIYNWYSSNNGVSWTGPGPILAPPGGALCKGISSAGNNDVFFIYDVSGGEAIGCSFYSTSWSALASWTLSPIAYGAGLAVVWSGSLYTIVYTDGYTLASCTCNPVGNVWSSGSVIAPATSTAIGRLYPHLSRLDGIYTITSIEYDSGLLTGSVYSYPRFRQSSDLVHWSDGMIIPDITCTYGAVCFKLPVPNSGSAGARYYVASLSSVYSAAAFLTGNTSQYLDVSAAVLSYQRLDQVGKPARLELLLDNAGGVYDGLVNVGGAYEPIGPNAVMVLSEGYKTGSPPTVTDVVKVGSYHIEQIHFVRSPQENHLLIVGLDVSRNLDLVSRYQNSYINQTLGYLVAEVCARAGLFALVLPSTSQMSQVVPSFVIQAGISYRHALQELCDTYGLSYFLDQNEVLQFYELSSSDPSVWSYQPEIELVSFGSSDVRANHIIISGKPPTGGQAEALTTAEAYDDTNLHLVGVERILHHVDQKLVTTTQCAQKASFLMLQEARSQVTHTVSVPLNPALQLLDCITLTDSSAPTGSGRSSACRIIHVLAHYDAQHGLDELQLGLEGV
jgi:hypothetical protein